jgi:hypothetical protein
MTKPPCVDGQIMQNETADDFEIVDCHCERCVKLEQKSEESDYDYCERLRETANKDDV